mgnify:CR=1 FL=1
MLGKIKSLMMHTSIIGTWSQVWWQVIFHINNLSHIFHLVTDSLVSIWSHIYSIVTTCSEVSDARWVKVLILRSRAVAFKLVELKLVFVRSSTDWPFINMMCSNGSMCFLLNELTIQWLISHLLLWVHLLILISAVILYVTR